MGEAPDQSNDETRGMQMMKEHYSQGDGEMDDLRDMPSGVCWPSRSRKQALDGRRLNGFLGARGKAPIQGVGCRMDSHGARRISASRPCCRPCGEMPRAHESSFSSSGYLRKRASPWPPSHAPAPLPRTPNPKIFRNPAPYPLHRTPTGKVVVLPVGEGGPDI